jgi:alanine racemase
VVKQLLTDEFDSENFPQRPAWTEIDLGKLRRNLQLIRRDLPRNVKLLAVVKDEAYGHGALDVARVALEEGAWGFGLSTLEEAMALRDAGITAPLLLLGERQEAELEWCVAHDLTVCVNEPHAVRKLARAAADFGKQRSGSRQNPHRHEPLRRALGRGAAAHRKNSR